MCTDCETITVMTLRQFSPLFNFKGKNEPQIVVFKQLAVSGTANKDR
jgi:hypothetical protein